MSGMAAIDELNRDRDGTTLRHPNSASDDSQSCRVDELGSEYLYTWYRELQYAKSGSTLFYYNELPGGQQITKFEEELVSEAKVLHRHLCATHPEICTGTAA